MFLQIACKRLLAIVQNLLHGLFRPKQPPEKVAHARQKPGFLSPLTFGGFLGATWTGGVDVLLVVVMVSVSGGGSVLL